MPKFDTQLQKQLQEYFAPLSSGFSNMLSPKEVAELQKAYGFEQPKPRQLSERDRAARLEAFNTNLATESAEMGKAFITNTANLPAEERYRAWEQAQEALKRQYAHLTEEQQQTALSAFNEHADVFRLADEEAGFFSRTGDLLSYVPTTFTKLGEQVTGLVAPESDARKWFKDATDEVESWRSDEAKMRALHIADATAKAKANGELGFTQFFANAVENPLETVGQFVESALPTVAAATAGVAAAPVTGGASLALPFVVGGVQGAGETRNEIYDHIMSMPQAQLSQSPEYQALLAKGLSSEQARQALASSITEHGGEVLATGLSSAALSQLGGLARIGQVGKGALGSTAGKFASELITEPTDEVFQQFMGNKAINDIDPTHSLTDGLGEAAAGGLLFGAAGGAIAAADNAYRKPSEEQIQANSDQAVDDITNNTQSEPQPTQPKSKVNGNVLESVLAGYQSDEARFDELYTELKSDIEDGRLQQRLNESDREYADLARSYLEQTGQVPPADFTADSQGNVQNNGVQAEQSAVENEQVFADAEVQAIAPEQETTQPVFDEDRLEQYRQASQDIVSAYQRGDITEREVNSRYAEIIQRYPEHQQLAQELYRRQQEDQEQQVLYSRSPMKSVEANIKRGQERMTQAILDKADVKRGMYNGEFGWVDFVWGDDGLTKEPNANGEPRGRGIAHVFEARERKDGQDYQQTSRMLVNDIVNTIAKGSIVTKTPHRMVLEYKENQNDLGHKAILTKDRSHNSNSWLLTGFENDPSKGRKANSNGERTVGYGTSTPTQTTPMRSRDNLGALEMHQQAGHGLNVQQFFQQRNPQTQADQQTLSRILGEETASHIQVVDRNTEIPSGKDVKKLVSDGVEGWFEISTKKLYLISDNITADETLSRDERLAWVAWHELAHAGVRVKYGDVLTRILAGASENTVVKVIARKIQQDRGDISYPVAVEEALVEIYAAYETGNWAALENRYKTKIHESYKQGKNSVADHLTQIANYIRKLMNLIFRNPKFTEKMTTADVFNTLSGIKEGINTLANSQQEQVTQDDVRYSLNENADSDFAKAVDTVANGGMTQQQIIDVGTTPAVLKMLGLPDTNVTISGAVLRKVMLDKHNVTAETLKQLPKQINNPVAVMKSSTQQNGYVVLTELTERVDGMDKPVVAALHLKQTQQGIELINIASVYGRNNSQIQRGLENDLLYWNKEKGAEFLNNFTLQLRSSSLENNSLKGAKFLDNLTLQLRSPLSKDSSIGEHIKTETDLSQYQSENSKQSTQVHSPQFKRWFGDSKVVDEKGNPLVVYHGSNANFSVFDKSKVAIDNLGTGFYFSSEEIANSYANRRTQERGGKENTYAVYLKMENPLDFRNVTREQAVEANKQELLAFNFSDADAQQQAEDLVDGFVADTVKFGEKADFAMALPDNKSEGMQRFIKNEGIDGFIVPGKDKVSGNDGIAYVVFEPNQIKSATDNNGSFDPNEEDIRYSVKQSVDNLAKTGKAEREAKQLSKLRTFNGFKSLVKEAGGWLDERIADGLRPVNDWIDTFKESGIAEHEAERLKDDMYRAKGVRDALNTEIEQEYLNPIIKKVAEIAKAHKLDELSAKRLAGYWISGRYAIEKNSSLLKQEHQAMLDAEKALNEANANGNSEEITLANREYRKAERQYRYRKHDVELALDSNEDFKVGTAGGWSNAEAANFMQNIEKHIPRKDLEALAELVYDLNQKRLDIDHQAGRYTEEQYNEFKANRHYVPLTGDPNADENFDSISGAGSNALNVSKDRSLKGRKLSEAEDGIDASWRAVGNTTTYAGWADFKNRIDEIFETRVSELVDKGYSQRAAREEVAETLGISKSKMQGMTRSSDDVLIRKIGGEYFEYRLPQNVMKTLKNDNVENANAFLKVLSKPTSWYARGVTQWTLTFAPMNMMRDTWEKSEFIRVQKLYDKNGKLLDDKTMDKIGRAVLKNAFLDKSVWAATKRLGFHQELRNSGSEALLKQLLKDGGVSTYSTYLAKTETDLINKLKAENNPLAKKLEQAGAVLEGYNKIFDNVSALAAYKALIDHGVDPKQAAAKTLELTNFRKTGSKMRGIKALYMFSQPTAMGARNLIKYLSTEKGQKRFFGYMAVMMPLYAVLRAMDEDDEGGNVMDQLGDITRYIPIPIGGGKYLKIPVGFGMPQMAWNFSVNIVKAGASDMSVTEAATNMLVHSLKTFAPVSPSEISAAKYPLEKLTLTATPTILQPLMQNVLNRSAFGNKITTNFVRDDKLKAEQSKSTTAQFWKDLAIGLNDTLGIDMHPEQIKNLFDGYSSVFGSLKELQTILVENPNREQLGRRTRTPFLNQFIGTTNEFAIQSRYYEASEEAQTFAKGYESRKERGSAETLLPKERQMLTWHQLNQKRMGELRSEKAKLTKALRKGTMSSNVYEAKLKLYNQQMDKEQRYLLKRWREIQGLNTH